MKKRWTKEEEQFLSEKWGSMNLHTISQRLNKTYEAVKIKGRRMGLGRVTEAQGKYITARQLTQALKICNYSLNILEEKGLKTYKKVLGSKLQYRLIVINEFWKWAEENKSLIRWDKLTENDLGIEPAWTKEARREAVTEHKKAKNKFKEWTNEEDLKLSYYSDLKLTDKEIASRLGRTKRGVIERRRTLFIEKGICKKWTTDKEEELKELNNKGLSYSEISKTLDFSYSKVYNKLRHMGLINGSEQRNG